MGKAMRTLLGAAALACVIPAWAQEEPALIPRPETLVMDEGRCVVAPGSVVATPAGLSSVAGTILGAAAGFPQKGSRDKWPRFTFNPAKPATLAFLDAILKEVAGLFPDAGVIHFGCDEVHFGWKQWPELPEVQELMRKEGLKDLVGVETWFNRRMAATINGLGFKTGGWDEITARDLPADRTVVFWWRNDKPALLRQALDAGYPVVLCPRRPCYFDFMTWPRLVALAEAAWTPASRKDWLDFQRRLPPHIADLTARGFRVHPLAGGPEVTE